MTCTKCGKVNQEHYKFCLGCGAELTAPDAAPAGISIPGMNMAEADTASAVPSPGGPPAYGGPGGGAPPELIATAPPETAPPSTPSCPSCGTPNPKDFTFCGNCGARLGQGQSQPTMSRGAPAPAPAASGPVAQLALIRPDGSEGGYHTVMEHNVILGRGSGPLFDNDAYLSPKHASLDFEGDSLVVADHGSLNGVFVRIVADEPLANSDIFRLGQELLRFDAIGEPQLLDDGTEILGSPNPGYWGRLSLIVSQGIDGSAFPLMGDEMILGRERGDILFSDDGYVSGTHAKISITDQGVYLTDLGSSNGTFIRIKEPRRVPFGTFVLIGQQLFRIDHG